MKKVHTNVKCLYLMSPIQCEPTFRLIRPNVYIQKQCISMQYIIRIDTITDSFLSFPNVAYACFECVCCNNVVKVGCICFCPDCGLS